MNLKTIIATIGIGLVLGLAIGFPAARLLEPVKTVTKTKVATVQNKIENNMTLNQLPAFFGQAAAIVQQPTTANGGIRCYGWAGPDASKQITNPGDWHIILCAKVQ